MSEYYMIEIDEEFAAKHLDIMFEGNAVLAFEEAGEQSLWKDENGTVYMTLPFLIMAMVQRLFFSAGALTAMENFLSDKEPGVKEDFTPFGQFLEETGAIKRPETKEEMHEMKQQMSDKTDEIQKIATEWITGRIMEYQPEGTVLR